MIGLYNENCQYFEIQYKFRSKSSILQETQLYRNRMEFGQDGDKLRNLCIKLAIQICHGRSWLGTSIKTLSLRLALCWKGQQFYAILKNAIQIMIYISKALESNLVMHCDQIWWQCFSRESVDPGSRRCWGCYEGPRGQAGDLRWGKDY